MTRNTALLYEELGVRRVGLTAVDYGRYVWAMCGFDFANDEERLSVLAAAEEFAWTIGFELGDTSEIAHSWEFAAISGFTSLRQVAETRGEPLEEMAAAADKLDEPMALFKALLIFSDHPGWEGVLDLSEESPGRDVLFDYTDIE